jgi:hypothetical protein
MSADNARLVEAGISFILILYCLLIFTGKIKLKRRSEFLEKNRRWLVILGFVGLLYPILEILSVVFKFNI